MEEEKDSDGGLVDGKELLLWRFRVLERRMKSSDKEHLDSRRKLLKSDKAGGTGGGSPRSGGKKDCRNQNIRRTQQRNPVFIGISEHRLKSGETTRNIT